MKQNRIKHRNCGQRASRQTDNTQQPLSRQRNANVMEQTIHPNGWLEGEMNQEEEGETRLAPRMETTPTQPYCREVRQSANILHRQNSVQNVDALGHITAE